MFAKSIHSLFRGLSIGVLAQRTRKAMWAMVLAASLMALASIVQDRYEHLAAGSSVSVLPDDGFAPSAASSQSDPVAKPHPEERRYRAIAEFVAKKYRVSQDVIFDLVSIAHAAGHQIGLDPLLIIAVMAVESRFNPIAESVAGAKGLMQIIPRYHTDKLDEFGGERAVFDPQINILVGSKILKEYLARTGNDLGMALQMYAGAPNDVQDIYTSKVMSEKQRLQLVVVSQTRRNALAKVSSARSIVLQPWPLTQ